MNKVIKFLLSRIVFFVLGFLSVSVLQVSRKTLEIRKNDILPRVIPQNIKMEIFFDTPRIVFSGNVEELRSLYISMRDAHSYSFEYRSAKGNDMLYWMAGSKRLHEITSIQDDANGYFTLEWLDLIHIYQNDSIGERQFVQTLLSVDNFLGEENNNNRIEMNFIGLQPYHLVPDFGYISIFRVPTVSTVEFVEITRDEQSICFLSQLIF